MNVRLARPDDLKGLYPLARDLALWNVVEQPAFEANFMRVLKDPDALLAVIDEGEALGGYLLGFRHPTFHANAPAAWVEELFVSLELRGKGYGRNLVAFFEDWARCQGCGYLALASRRAGPFYEKIGFENRAAYFKRPIRG